jgi:TM2 domain-containing membrane protein YozV
MSSGDEYSAPRFSSQEQVQAQPQVEAGPQYQAIPQGQTSPQYQAGQYPAGPQYQVGPQYQAGPQVVLPKNPAVGVILSFFIPGLGSMVNGAGARGAIILGVYIVGWILSIVLIGIPILIGAWIWGLVDGYLSAQRWNQVHGIVS